MTRGRCASPRMERSLDMPPMTRDVYSVRNDVRSLRGASGLSQADLAAVLGVSRQTINAIESGRWTPSLPLAFAIARHFKCRVEEVFHDDIN